MAGTPSLVTLTGYLGRNPETRSTQERTYEASHYNEVAEMFDHYEGHIPSRAYLVLSVATKERGETRWHRLVVWNGDQVCFRNIRLAGTGDLVRVEGRPDSFKVGEPGAERVIEQFVVQSFQVLRRSSKHRPPEIP